MPRPLLNYVAEIGTEIALPLARHYCQRHRVKYPVERDAGEGMWWAGAFVDGGLRAVMALASLGDDGMLVSGIFTDGSKASVTGARMLLLRLTELPCDLYGTLHLPTQQARRAFRQQGWRLLQGVV